VIRRPLSPARRTLTLIAAAGVAAATLTACGSGGNGGGSSAGGSAGSITLYSGQHEQTTQSLVTAFEKQTGIHVNVRYDDEDTFADEIVTEQSHPVADVFYTENSPALEYLQEKGLLASVTPATLSATPSQYDSAQGDWVGVSARVSVIVYNPSLISASQLPTSVTQLSDPKYAGKVGIAPSETDFQPIVTSVERTYGKPAALSWLKGLKANAGSHSYPDNETLVDEVNRGTVPFGVLNQYYWYRMQAEIGAGAVHSKLAFFAPQDPGYVVDVSGAAVLKSSKNQADAQKFLAFLVSKQGQQIIKNSISFEYPLDDGVSASSEEPAFNTLQPNAITVADLGDGSTAVSLLQQAGLL
jgi:iron(III) transport system substrate-binding protein